MEQASLLPSTEETGAIFSRDRVYRYRLWRIWDKELPKICWIMLNPSTATETILDPTVKRCCNYSIDWGYGGIEILNLFALRSTDPKRLFDHADPIGPKNDYYIITTARTSKTVVAAWGIHGSFMNRAKSLYNMLMLSCNDKFSLMMLGMAKDGNPKHPLYLKSELKPEPWIMQ